MYRIRISAFVMSFVVAITQSGFSQEKEGEKEFQESVVKGRLVQNEKKEFEIDFGELKTTFNQLVQLPQPTFPDNWAEMDGAARQKWITEFEASDKGKSLVFERKKMIDAAARFELNVEENGNFIIYDVPDGTYGLRGRTEKVIDEKNFVCEVFGQVIVSKDVEEVLLDPIMLTVTRLLKATEMVPDFEITTFDGKAKIRSNLLKDHFVLLSFWALESPPSLEFSKSIQEMYENVRKEHGLQLLSICIDSDLKKALAHVKKNRVRGWHGHADSWNHDIISEFGVRVIPALFLVNPKGEVVMTHNDFRRAFQAEDAQLQQIVVDAITGKNVPTPAETKAGK